MTKKDDEKVRVWHPVQKAEATPRRADLDAWLEKGWLVKPAAKTKETDK